MLIKVATTLAIVLALIVAVWVALGFVVMSGGDSVRTVIEASGRLEGYSCELLSGQLDKKFSAVCKFSADDEGGSCRNFNLLGNQERKIGIDCREREEESVTFALRSSPQLSLFRAQNVSSLHIEVEKALLALLGERVTQAERRVRIRGVTTVTDIR